MKISITLISYILGAAIASPSPSSRSDNLKERALTVTVDAPAGTIIGKQELFTEKFSGIPYAEPPVGERRLTQAVRLEKKLDNFEATGNAPACPQFVVDASSLGLLDQVISTVNESPFFRKALQISEDCLNVNIIRPKGTKAGDDLPVLFWIYRGGYELGFNAMYDGTGLVTEAAAAGKPYIFVAVNYRVGAWGFLGGKEIAAAGSANMGSLDQRRGLEFVADNIRAFGGDPDKVTIWGESAGSWSVWNQMAAFDGDNTYKGRKLFRGAIMHSGSLLPAEPIDSEKPQRIYDQLVDNAGCSGAQDTLDCLRKLPFEVFNKAAKSFSGMFSYTSLSLAFMPRPDGKFMTKSPQLLLKERKYAQVPFIIGHQEDEGTLFLLFNANISSSTELMTNYYNEVFFPKAPRDKVAELVQSYPESITAGSPFRTSIFNELYPGFKRFAALLGDFLFTMTRRVVLETHATNFPEVPAWSYTASYGYGLPFFGTTHGTDLVQVFFGLLPDYAQVNIRKYYANFVYNLDPNDDSGGNGQGSSRVPDNWPKWESGSRINNNFYKLFFKQIKDDFRQDSYEVIKRNIDYLLQ